jgi:hypothetical protein
MTVWYNKIMNSMGLVFYSRDGWVIMLDESGAVLHLGKNAFQALGGCKWVKLGKL